MLVFHAIACHLLSQHDIALQRLVEIILRYFHKAIDASGPSPALALSAPEKPLNDFETTSGLSQLLAGLEVSAGHVKVAEIEIGQSGILQVAHSFHAILRKEAPREL